MAEKDVKEETKQVDPQTEIGNYLIQVVADDGKSIIRQLVANKCTIKVVALGDQSFSAEVR
jgi:hypothetical protein